MGLSIEDYTSSLNGLQDLYERTKTSSSLENDLKTTDYTKATDEQLMEVCKSFESYFVEQVFKSMEKMVPKSDDKDESPYLKMFGDNLPKEYAKIASDSNDGKGLGLAQMLFDQMKRNYGLDN